MNHILSMLVQGRNRGRLVFKRLTIISIILTFSMPVIAAVFAVSGALLIAEILANASVTTAVLAIGSLLLFLTADDPKIRSQK